MFAILLMANTSTSLLKVSTGHVLMFKDIPILFIKYVYIPKLHIYYSGLCQYFWVI